MSEQQSVAVQTDRAIRTKQGKFVPGSSGNPSGRPALLKQLRDLAREHTEASVAKIVMLMHNAESETVQLESAKELLNRAWGRPEQFIDLGVTVEHKSEMVERILALLQGKVIEGDAKVVADQPGESLTKSP